MLPLLLPLIDAADGEVWIDLFTTDDAAIYGETLILFI
jgi:hypothetical protein